MGTETNQDLEASDAPSWRDVFAEIDRDVVLLRQERLGLRAARGPSESAAAVRVADAYRIVSSKKESVKKAIEVDAGIFSCSITGYTKMKPPNQPRRDATRREIMNYRAAIRNFHPRLPLDAIREWLILYLGLDHLQAQDVVDHVEHIGPEAVLQGKSQALAVEAKKRLEELGAQVRILENVPIVSHGEVGKPQREPISESVRHEVWRRDGGKCVDCGSRERLEFDHIIPVSRGGSNTARNLELRCEVCNRSKGARI